MKKQLLLILMLFMLPFAYCTAQVTDSSAQWTWMGGSPAATNQNGVFVTKGVFSPGNIPGSRQTGVSWKDKEGNFWVFGGVGTPPGSGANGHLNDLWKFDVSLQQWAFMNGNAGDINKTSTYGSIGAEDDSYRPAGRSSPATWVDTAGDLWLFGGNGDGPITGAGAGDYLNDLWKYNVTTNRWAYMGGTFTKAALTTYGTRGMPDINNLPGGRIQVVAWADKDNNFWFFSGHGPRETSTKATLNELWKYNPATREWTWVSGSKTANEAGVYGQTGVPSTANLPGSRNDTRIAQDAEGNIWLFGGSGYATSAGTSGRLNDLWKFYPATGAWAYMGGSQNINQTGVYGTRGESAPGNMPGGRFGHWLFAGKDGNIWVFAARGLATNTTEYRLNDLWKFDTTSHEWTWVKGSNANATPAAVPGTQGTPAPGNTPSGKTAFVGWEDPEGNFWVFAGVPASGIYNDFWRLAPVITAPAQPGQYTAAPASVCQGESNVVYTVPAVTGADAYAWSYTGGTGVIFPVNDTTINPTNTVNFSAGATSGTLQVVAFNSGAASPPRDTAITVNVLPTVTSTNTGSRSICAGDSLLLTASGSSGVSYQWKEGTTNVGTGATYYAKVAGSYTVTATNTSTNCSATSTPATVLSVNTLPTVTSTNTGSRSICSGDSLLLTASGSSGVNYQWKQGTTNVGTGATYYAKVAGSYTVTATNTSTNCSATSTPATVLSVNTLPTVTSTNTGSRSICSGDSLLLTASGSSGVNYQWKQGTTNVGTGVTYYAKTAGSYTVTATNTSTNCSATSTPATVLSVSTLPTVTSTNTGSRSICAGDSLLLTASGSSGVSYQWKQGTTNVGTGATYYAKTAGSYTVTATNTGTNCSTTSAPATVLAVNPLPVASVTAGGATEVCSGETVSLTSVAVNGADYQWKQGTIPVGTNSNSYMAGATGAYKVVVTYTATGCSDSTAPVDVVVYDRPVVSLVPGDTAFCDGGVVTLEVTSQDTGLTYRWKNGNATIPMANAYFLEITETGVYSVVTGRSQVGNCEDSTNEVTVAVHPLPVVNVTWDGAQFHATPGHSSYQWHTSGQGIPAATDSTFVPTSDGGYSVTVTDDNDCSNTSPVYNVTLDINDLVSLNGQIKVYPNPVSGSVYIASPVAVSVSLSSIDGKLLLYGTDVRQVDLGNFTDGVYMLRITDQNGGFIRFEKLIKSSR